MLFSHTVPLAVTVALLFRMTIAAPVPTDLSSVDFTRHNRVHLQSLGGTSIMNPLEARADSDTPERIFNCHVNRKHDSAINAFKKANTHWETAKSVDKEKADHEIKLNNHQIQMHEFTKMLYDTGGYHDYEQNAKSYATAIKGKETANISETKAKAVIQAHEDEKAEAKAKQIGENAAAKAKEKEAAKAKAKEAAKAKAKEAAKTKAKAAKDKIPTARWLAAKRLKIEKAEARAASIEATRRKNAAKARVKYLQVQKEREEKAKQAAAEKANIMHRDDSHGGAGIHN